MFKQKEPRINKKIKLTRDDKKTTNNFQIKSKTNNFQEFQKVYGRILNKQIGNETSLMKTMLPSNGFSSSSEVKMIRIEMPKLGSEHAILHPHPSKLLGKKINSGNNYARKTMRSASAIKLLMEGTRDTSKKLKQIQKMLEERRHQIEYSTNNIKQKNIQDRTDRKYGSFSSLMKKNVPELDTEIKTIFENTFIGQKESLQEIPEEDLEELTENSKNTEFSEQETHKEEVKPVSVEKYVEQDDIEAHSKQMEIITFSDKNENDLKQRIEKDICNIKAYTIEYRKKKLNPMELLNNKQRLCEKANMAESQRRKSFDSKSTSEQRTFHIKSEINKCKQKKAQKTTTGGKIISKKKVDKEKITAVPNNRFQTKSIQKPMLPKQKQKLPQSLILPNILTKKFDNHSVCKNNRKL